MCHSFYFRFEYFIGSENKKQNGRSLILTVTWLKKTDTKKNVLNGLPCVGTYAPSKLLSFKY